ncbi:unnamed protein product [Cyclocybe aegerita]|uniref:Uncharacterized protein n=1 Tax=Cyclocybe aegerita TaxID=1973307 RepID=A0A8S0X6E0_CYCAE|nr:unnamed protein product [Cyclocybe aegerita]
MPGHPQGNREAPTALKFDKPDIDTERSRFTDHYPDAFTDTYGTVIYKTGSAWPKREGGPDAQPYIREMRPVHGHPITSSWPEILRKAEAYLDGRQVEFTAITGFAFADAGDKTPFCPLLVTIVDDEPVHCGPQAPVPQSPRRQAYHVHTRPRRRALKTPYYDSKGSVRLYLRRRRKDSDGILALTAAHAARPPPMHRNTGLSRKDSDRHREDPEMVALGNKAYEDATTAIDSRIGTVQDINEEEAEDREGQGRSAEG